MLSIFVISFYDNFGLLFKGPEDTMTERIEKLLLLTTPLSVDAPRARIRPISYSNKT